MSELAAVNRDRLAELITRERVTYRDKFPGSAKAFAAGGNICSAACR